MLKRSRPPTPSKLVSCDGDDDEIGVPGLSGSSRLSGDDAGDFVEDNSRSAKRQRVIGPEAWNGSLRRSFQGSAGGDTPHSELESDVDDDGELLSDSDTEDSKSDGEHQTDHVSTHPSPHVPNDNSPYVAVNSLLHDLNCERMLPGRGYGAEGHGKAGSPQISSPSSSSVSALESTFPSRPGATIPSKPAGSKSTPVVDTSHFASKPLFPHHLKPRSHSTFAPSPLRQSTLQKDYPRIPDPEAETEGESELVRVRYEEINRLLGSLALHRRRRLDNDP